MIEQYLKNTHTDDYGYNMKNVKGIFKPRVVNRAISEGLWLNSYFREKSKYLYGLYIEVCTNWSK